MVVLAASPLLGQNDERPTLQVGVLGEELRIDGRLDEPAWAAAPVAADLLMVEPRQGARPPGRTLVKVLAGPKALAFGIRCEDPDASGIVSFTKERDGNFEFEDQVTSRPLVFSRGRLRRARERIQRPFVAAGP